MVVLICIQFCSAPKFDVVSNFNKHLIVFDTPQSTHGPHNLLQTQGQVWARGFPVSCLLYLLEYGHASKLLMSCTVLSRLKSGLCQTPYPSW